MSTASPRGSSPKFFPTTRRFARGDLIGGKYRLIELVGAGAMGMVWVAKNELLDVDVAVKLLRVVDNQRVDPNKLYRRLLQEARAAARLGHPGIVRVFDFGQEADNTPFIVMEMLEGESLATLMHRQRKMAPAKAIQLLLPVVDALATAHGRGIVHRDVKPENIFLAKDEYGRIQPKVVDFGVARFAEGGRSLTRSGALMGTPDYMAPEQARGEEDIDHRVDIWALAVVLYELMVGRRPFSSDNTHYLAVLRSIVQERAPSILDFGVGDRALWIILERALRKPTSERWDTMRVFGEALALWLYEHGVKEDSMGASLKTTWLQMGFDGIKIETSSVAPPPMPRARNASLPSSIEIDVGSIEADLVEESGPRAARKLAESGLFAEAAAAAGAARTQEGVTESTTRGATGRGRSPRSRVALAFRLAVAFSLAAVFGFVAVTLATQGADPWIRPDVLDRGLDTRPAATPTPRAAVVAEEFSAYVPPALAPSPSPPSDQAPVAPVATEPESAAIEADPEPAQSSAAPPAPRRVRSRTRSLPPARTFDFGF